MRKQALKRILVFACALALALSLSLEAFAKYKTIPLGEKSDAVRVMQNALKKKGFYKGTVDGNFGPATRKAVMRYQSSLGIKADGRPGDKTLTALYDGGSSAINIVINRKASTYKPKDPNSMFYGCTGARVRTLQKALRAAGYFKGTIDGVFGELTELAVRKFQTAKGMHVDGIAGTKTLARLNKAQKSVRVAPSFLLDVGSKGDTVSSLQRKLTSLNFYDVGDPACDRYGNYGKYTADAVRAWQGKTGRPQTGSISQKEYNALILSK